MVSLLAVDFIMLLFEKIGSVFTPKDGNCIKMDGRTTWK